MKKMVRKILLFTVDDERKTQSNKKVPSDSLIVAHAPSYMHVASIMNERTQDEKENFGRVNLGPPVEDETSLMAFRGGNDGLTEANIDSVIMQFLSSVDDSGSVSIELITDACERSKNRFGREFSKL